MEKELYTVKEVATLMGIHSSTVIDYINRGWLESEVKVEVRKKHAVKFDSIKKCIREVSLKKGSGRRPKWVLDESHN